MAWVPRVQLHLLNPIKLFILAGSNNICIWFTSSFCLDILVIFNYRANILCYSLHKLSYVLGIINLEQSVCV